MNFGIFIMLAIAALWVLGIFLGLIGGVSKTFTKAPDTMDSTDLKTQEEQSIQDTQEKQKQMMEDLKQKMQDEQSRKF